MMDIIRKKPKLIEKESTLPRESGKLTSGMNTAMGAMQGYNGGTVQAGGTMMGMQ